MPQERSGSSGGNTIANDSVESANTASATEMCVVQQEDLPAEWRLRSPSRFAARVRLLRAGFSNPHAQAALNDPDTLVLALEASLFAGCHEASITDDARVVARILSEASTTSSKAVANELRRRVFAIAPENESVLERLARDFVQRRVKKRDASERWLISALAPANWVHWARVGLLLAAAGDDAPHLQFSTILEQLLRELRIDSASTSKQGPGASTAASVQIGVRNVVEIAVLMERYVHFVQLLHDDDLQPKAPGNSRSQAQTYHALSPNQLACGARAHEMLVQQLCTLRAYLVLCAGQTCAKNAMVEWSVRARETADMYAMQTASTSAANAVRYAVGEAFAQASWDPAARVRSTYIPVFDSPRLWTDFLEMSDAFAMAVLLAPWDARRAVAMLDRAIGLHSMLPGAPIPVYELRRVLACRAAQRRFAAATNIVPLVMRRLSVLFEKEELCKGGDFTPDAPQFLTSAAADGNFAAQTVLGLLQAGSGEFWDVARQRTGVHKDLHQGIRTLLATALLADPDALTAVTYLWAQNSETVKCLEAVSVAEIHQVFGVAFNTQNARAVLNLGALWRYGAREKNIEPGKTVAMESFIIALQGCVAQDVRAVAAAHLDGMLGEELAEKNEGNRNKSDEMRKVLFGYMKERAKCSTEQRGDSPHRIDDIRDSP